ncbi:NAD(P)-binding protein [Meredithblackwellia eburnea MCA 4105]
MSIPKTAVTLQITERKQEKPLTLARVEVSAELKENELLIENVAVAQASGDIKKVALDLMIPTIPFTTGWENSGKVVLAGDAVKDFQVGDRITAWAHANEIGAGAYQQFTKIHASSAAKIPSSLTFEGASTLPLAFATALGCLNALGLPPNGPTTSLPLPPQPKMVPPILIWGAGSSVGAMAVQIAKLSGFRVIATASPSSFEYVKKCGADWVFNYRDEEKVIEEIKKAGEDKVTLVFDPISTTDSVTQSLKALGASGGKVIVDLPGVAENFEGKTPAGCTVEYAGAYHCFLKPELHSGFKMLESMIAKDQVVVHPFEVLPDGLASVNEGWRRQRAGEVRATKLVYRIADTPGLKEIQ